LNQTEFFLANQVDGQLTPEQAQRMLALPPGDSMEYMQGDAQPSVAAIETDPTATAEVKETPPAEPAAPAEPVVLAKDGVHTIPFQELEEARTTAQTWQQKAAELQAQLDAAKTAAAPAAAPAPAGPAEPDGIQPGVFGDFSEEALAKGVAAIASKSVEAAVAKVMDSALAPLLKKHEVDATEAHFNAIHRSEERRVGKECRSRWSPYH
jgi:hypothetical protein